MKIQACLGLLSLFGVSVFFNKADALLGFDENYSLFIKHFLTCISAPKRIVEFHCRKLPTTAISYGKSHIETNYFVTFVNITRGVPETIFQFDRVVFIVDLQCPNFNMVFDKAKENHLFRKSNVWMFFGNTNQINSNLFYSKYHRVFTFYAKEFIIEVYNIFKITESSRLFSVILVCKWSMNDEAMIYWNSDNRNKMTDFRREPIRVSYALIYQNSFHHLTDYRYPQQDQPSKITFLLMDQLCKLFNATHVPIFRHTWGNYINLTKTYETMGMFSDIQTGIADIAGNTALTTNDRLQHFRYLASTGNLNVNKLVWFFKAPPLSYTENIWILPFTKRLWCVIFISLTIWYICFVGIAMFEFNLSRKGKFNEENPWYIALDIVLTTFTLRGSYITFSTYAGRLICYCLFLLFTVLNMAYTANFLVLLQSTGNSIRKFENLLDSGMDLGSLNESYNIMYFTTPNDRVEEGVRQKIFSAILRKKNRFWFNVSEGCDMVKNGVFAFHLPTHIGYDQIAKTYDEATKRSLRTVDSVIRFNNYLCVSKYSALEDYFSYGFLYLQETGVMRREQKRLFAQKPPPDYSKAIFSSLNMTDLVFIFMILTVGVALSILILILEIMVIYL